jgi:hypothetical protein
MLDPHNASMVMGMLLLLARYGKVKGLMLSCISQLTNAVLLSHGLVKNTGCTSNHSSAKYPASLPIKSKYAISIATKCQTLIVHVYRPEVSDVVASG